MGTEILPRILDIFQFIIGAIGIVALSVVVLNAVAYRRTNSAQDRVPIKKRLFDALLTLLFVLLAYLLISSIGPIFQVIF